MEFLKFKIGKGKGSEWGKEAYWECTLYKVFYVHFSLNYNSYYSLNCNNMLISTNVETKAWRE